MQFVLTALWGFMVVMVVATMRWLEMKQAARVDWVGWAGWVVESRLRVQGKVGGPGDGLGGSVGSIGDCQGESSGGCVDDVPGDVESENGASEVWVTRGERVERGAPVAKWRGEKVEAPEEVE